MAKDPVDNKRSLDPEGHAVQFSNIKPLGYANSDKTAIECEVTVHEGCDHMYAGQTHLFTCTSWDKEPHGMKLWEELNSGTHGKISPFKKPAN